MTGVKAAGNTAAVPASLGCGSETGETETTSGGEPFVRPLGTAAAKRLVPSKLDQFHRENPDYLKTALRTWTTKYGCVVMFGGMKVYYGRCKDCSGLVTTRRHRAVGRWPQLCQPCRHRKQQAKPDAVRKHMAELRRKRYEFRDEQFTRLGLPPVRQGVPMGGLPKRERCSVCGYLDCTDRECDGTI